MVRGSPPRPATSEARATLCTRVFRPLKSAGLRTAFLLKNAWSGYTAMASRTALAFWSRSLASVGFQARMAFLAVWGSGKIPGNSRISTMGSSPAT